jgi:hypothetical protein
VLSISAQISYVALRAELAGDFLATLDEVLRESDAKGLTMADAFVKTLGKLRTKKPTDTSSAEYGARVLALSLLGNGGVRLCSPAKEKP